MFTYLAGEYVSNIRHVFRFPQNCNVLCLDGRMLIYGCDFGIYKSSPVQCDVFPFSMKRKQYIYVYHCPIVLLWFIVYARVMHMCVPELPMTYWFWSRISQNIVVICWQEYFVLYSVAFDAHLDGRLVPCKWNKAWRSSEVYRCIERKIIWQKNGGSTSS